MYMFLEITKLRISFLGLITRDSTEMQGFDINTGCNRYFLNSDYAINKMLRTARRNITRHLL